MAQTWFHRCFAHIRSTMPGWIANPIRSTVTAFLTPILFSWNSGHFRSCFKRAAVTRDGAPLPWYTYPAIELLRHRSYSGRTILEFGAGQSTRWWAERAAHVVSFEGDPDWHRELSADLARNVELHLVPVSDAAACVSEVERILKDRAGARFDVVVIDGLWRFELIATAVNVVSSDGVIVCDNSEGYGIQQGFAERGLQRVDLFGYSPGGPLPGCTSIYFRPGAFVFDPRLAIPDPTLPA